MPLKRLAGFVLIAICGFFGLHTSAAAQQYPSRPVHMIIAFPAGGTLDTLARTISQKLSEKWGQSLLVEVEK